MTPRARELPVAEVIAPSARAAADIRARIMRPSTRVIREVHTPTTTRRTTMRRTRRAEHREAARPAEAVVRSQQAAEVVRLQAVEVEVEVAVAVPRLQAVRSQAEA